MLLIRLLLVDLLVNSCGSFTPSILLLGQDIMDEVSQILDDIEGVTMVHTWYYDLGSEYYKVQNLFMNPYDFFVLLCSLFL